MEISLAPETIFHLGNLAITNSILTGWIISVCLLVGALFLRSFLRKIPSRIQNFIEIVYTFFLDMTTSIIGNQKAAQDLFPYLITLFFFVLISNWSGLIPGFSTIHLNNVPLLRAPTTDLNTVGVFALLSVGYVQYLGIKYSGLKNYSKKFFDFSSPLNFAIGLLEFMGEFTRIISFTFRLFGNIFAGEVLISVMLFLTISLLPFFPVLPLPFFLLETFVGIIQAFIFCFLTIVFTAVAVAGHGDHEAHSISNPSLIKESV